MPVSSDSVSTVPTGFHGVFSSRARVAGVYAASRASRVKWNRPLARLLFTARAVAHRQPDGRLVRIVDRIGKENFIARSEDGHQRRIDSQCRAVSDQNLGRGIVSDSILLCQLLCDRLPQFELAAIVRVRRAARLQGAYRGFDNVWRCCEIRLARISENSFLPCD